MTAMLTGMKQNLNMTSICISMMAKGTEHFSKYFLAACISSLGTGQFISLAQFLTWWLVFYLGVSHLWQILISSLVSSWCSFFPSADGLFTLSVLLLRGGEGRLSICCSPSASSCFSLCCWNPLQESYSSATSWNSSPVLFQDLHCDLVSTPSWLSVEWELCI